MNRTVIAAAIGVLMLGGTTLASARGPSDQFRFQSHPGQRMDRRADHESHLSWQRDYRGFSRHDEQRWQPEHERGEHRFEARRDYDRDDHAKSTWHGRDHDER